MTQSQGATDDDRIVEIYAAANEIDAGAVRAVLQEAGIESRIVGELVGNAFDLPLDFSGPRIWVRAADAGPARRLVEELQERLGEDDAGMETLDVGEPDSDESYE